MGIVVLDVDDVCANLMDEWLREYNRDYHDNLERGDIRSWTTSDWVKRECGGKIYQYISNPRIYDEVLPTDGALSGVMRLREFGHRVVFATTPTDGTRGRKLRWLNDWGFHVAREDYIECADKSLVYGDVIFDDKFANVKNFIGDYRFLMERPWSEIGESMRGIINVPNWFKFLDELVRVSML